jgi:hypothetical protein
MPGSQKNDRVFDVNKFVFVFFEFTILLRRFDAAK